MINPGEPGNLHRAARGHPEIVAFLQEKGDDLRAAGCPVQLQAQAADRREVAPARRVDVGVSARGEMQQ